MPPSRTAQPIKRKPPSFKPPRPASHAAPKPTAPPRRKSAPAKPPSFSSSPSSSSSPDPAPTATTSSTAVPNPANDAPPIIPPKLLTRLLHHHFEDQDRTRIGKDAGVLLGKYVETFVREAIARAAFEREGGGEFLEVEDLEKLAPQLLLDF